MRRITTTAGTPVETDGDVLAIIETLSRDLARRADLDYSFEEIDQEPVHELQPVRKRPAGAAGPEGVGGD